MTEPEIARRCPTCGATIRDSAFFCPQCGKKLPSRNKKKSKASASRRLDETIAERAPPVSDSKPELGMETLREIPADMRKESLPQSGPEVRSSENKTQEKSTEDAHAGEAKGSLRPGALGAVGAKIHRATTLARDVEGDVVQRVQKVRAISNVVLDEAGYDPSLRFVLVAAVLFLLFLIIVVLNKFIN